MCSGECLLFKYIENVAVLQESYQNSGESQEVFFRLL